MARNIGLAVLLLFASVAAGAQQTCVCTNGCKIASDPYPPGPGQPTSCAVYKNTVQLANSPTVLSSTIPTSNATVCKAPSAAYNPGVAGSVSCQVVIPAQPAGSITITMTATNSEGETAQSSPFTFQSVAALPTLPNPPTNPRPN